MEEKLGFGLMIVALIISLYFSINTSALIPRGYNLGVDGVIVSKTMMIALSIYIISKLGQILLLKKKG